MVKNGQTTPLSIYAMIIDNYVLIVVLAFFTFPVLYNYAQPSCEIPLFTPCKSIDNYALFTI